MEEKKKCAIMTQIPMLAVRATYKGMKFPNPFKLLYSFFLHWHASRAGFATIADTATQEIRNSICNSCPLNDNGQCQACGCLILAKTSLALEQCPKKKWNRVWRKRPVNRTLS